METYAKIPITKPWAWIKDKYYASSNQKGIFILHSLPFLPVVLGVVADLLSIYDYNPDNLTKTILWFLFIYGIINLLLLFLVQRTNFRLSKTKQYYKVLHKEVIEPIREFYTKKREGNLNCVFIEDTIKNILKSFNDNYMKKAHREAVSVTIKFKINNELYPIRVGYDADDRNSHPENEQESFVYMSLCRTGKKKQVIYVKDIENTDSIENKMLGDNVEDIQLEQKENIQPLLPCQ